MDWLTRIDRFLTQHLSPAVKKIFVINVLVFLGFQILVIVSERAGYVFLRLFGENPDLSLPRLLIWQFVTYMFVHVDGLHLLFNMIILWFFAPEMEYRWGTRRFWRFYLIVGAGAALIRSVSSFFVNTPMGPLIGASGALFGIMLAFAAYYPNRLVYFWGILPIPIKYLIPIIIAFEVMALRTSGVTGVSNLTHLAGLVAAYAWLTRYHHTADIRRWRYMR